MISKKNIASIKEENDYILCPHTAVGVAFHYSVPPTTARVYFLAVQDSSIGDIVSPSVTNSDF